MNQTNLVRRFRRQGRDLRLFVSFCTLVDGDMLRRFHRLTQETDSAIQVMGSSITPKRSTASWERSTREALATVDAVIVLVGTFLDSQIRDEVRFAKSLGKTVVAVVEESFEPRVARVPVDEIIVWRPLQMLEEITRVLDG